jgi:pimeloyl-ACP methyl ester carboxylesterase
MKRRLPSAETAALSYAGAQCSGSSTASARPQYAHAVAETSYANCGDLSLAYQVFGDGPLELVFVGPIVTHVELFWAMPEFKAFFDQLATFCRVLLFDKAGVGLSDPIPKVRLLEERAAEIEAVMDAVGFEKPVLFGMSEGGPQAIVFAAKRPERTRALILYGSLAFASWVRTTRRRSSRSSACRRWAARPAGNGAAVQQPRKCSRRSGRCASSPRSNG